MKRLIIALLVGGMVFGVVFAAAAALTVTGGGAQSGATRATCDRDGVNVTYQNTDINPDFDQATVTDVECSGTLDVSVSGHDAGHGILAAGSNSAGVGPTVIIVLSDELTNPADVAALSHTHVTIVQTGP